MAGSGTSSHCLTLWNSFTLLRLRVPSFTGRLGMVEFFFFMAWLGLTLIVVSAFQFVMLTAEMKDKVDEEKDV